VSKADGENRGQTGRAHSLFFNAAIAQASALLGRKCGALRVGGVQLYALHFSNSTLSGLDRAQDSERSSAGLGGTTGWRSTGGRVARVPRPRNAGRDP